ncbi:hypothetical protein PF005_g15897 [Phytophthora fragariae]|uniref:Uncharacterized protein n=1 Tax=Phytophthora fragariae TaxID=53985 RepID=A0A6A3EHL2_9STRA|nr:hypothetical protein PF009_g16899 [Phytophthora fragariae]KAE9098486.1 hypothetical protein PF007_g16244 [Phytophthora fragariae]KAE9199040.1 hypothetical protein PF005_g15897 [Phytophthora fragariae]KAE9214531.1 hypothetical protein PF004_g15018 [Phytophthora fragariae]
MWAALNVSAGDARASAAQARATEEAQDADNTALYEQALRCQQRRESARARELYEQLLSGAVAVSARLEYLCHKNLASMEVEARAFEAALSCFARALALDATDVVVWSQMGEAALETGKLWLARRALEEGLKVDATYWPLARTLAEVLHEVGDVEAYARVAAHIRAHDPLCASVRLIDGPNSEEMGTNRDSKLLRRARKRLNHLHSITQGQMKRRKVLEQQSSEQLKRRTQSRTYELQQPSWSALGKLLLEAFEDGNRSDGVDVIRAAVQIQVSYEQVEVARVEEEEEKEGPGEAVGVASEENQPSQEPPAKRAKQKEVVKVAAALETSLSTGVSDNDTPDSGIQLSDLLEFPPRRRKSRRNEERLREEHAAAVKKAREKDLAYRLGAFLPEALGEEERESTPDSVSIEWLSPLSIHLVDSKFRVSDAIDEDDPSARGESNKKRIEMVLESLRHSSKYSDDDTVLFLLTTTYYVIDFLDGLAVTKEPSSMDDSPDEACTNALAALEFLLTQLTQNQCERISTSDHWLLLRALSIRCLKPTILLRYDSPSEVLSMIRAALEINPAAGLSGDGDSMDQMIGVDAMARLLYVIRSLSSEDFRNLFTLVPHPVKRKQPRRDRIRVVLVELLRFVNRAIQGNEKLAVSLPLPKRSALMTVCYTLMKEEEETVARSDGKIPRQLFGNGAILFVLLFESCRRPGLPTSLPQLVDLIHLLHERLGQHGICGLTYFSDSRSSADSGKTSCFLESCTLLLSKFVKTKTSVRDEEKAIKISGDSSAEEDNEEDNEDEEETEYRFQKEVCQCYRCLYDVQILPGTDDHKTGATFASLQNQERSLKHEDALRLTRYAVPILLATKPKTNGQKKERLKLLYAVRDALSDSDFAALSAQPASVSPPLEAYLAPRGLLQEEVPPPFSLGVGTATKSPDETCLGHLWYLMGANFILARVKRRGNLDELMEMEQHVRERVEFLMKDVLYYHPDRIDSWIRLGKTMKELYHAATDAFAAVLGRKFRIQALRWYTAKIFVEDSSQDDVLSFQKVVLRWSLFKKIKEWQGKDIDGHKAASKASNSKDSKEESKENTDQNQPAPSIPIEEFAMTYIMQVIEFARRCFDMAVRLAEEAVKSRKLKLQSKRESTDEGAEGEGDDIFDEQLDALQNTLIECNEECGLLLYNVLQEFSLMKELSAALFPLTVYSRLVEKTLAYFRRGLASCEANEDAHEDHFRLLYMTGKTLKKMRWCELRRQELSDLEALSTATEMADCFAKAEAARDEGDREHALVHAFYSLQALRIDLTISESPSVSALRLVCDHFYEEEDGEEVEEEAEEEEGDDESTDSTSIRGTDEKSNSQETVASTASEGSTKTAGSKLTGDTKSASSSRKDGILALLSDAESDEDLRELNVTLARGWLALNIIEALESIPDEDRYFHPSRYVLARLVYWLSTFYSALEQNGYKDAAVSVLLDAVLARRNETQVEGPSDAAARALKEMAPIFDKRRPQIVAIWFSEYIPSAKKFEELNQRQMKYDYYRLKYWRFYIALLQENEAYGRLKEVGSWVLACKEDHDVIDIMLGIVLRARGNVLRSRLQVFLDAMEGVSTGRAGDDLMDMTQTQPPGEDRSVDALLKQLAKAYSSYLEVSSAQQRLAHVMDDSSLLLENAELPMVAVFFVGVTAYPLEMQLLEKDRAILDREFNANVVVIKNALRRDELPPRIYDAHGREAWRTYLDAARSFCEEKWPERSGKGKPTKKHSRPKAVAAAPTTTSSTDLSQPTANASS